MTDLPTPPADTAAAPPLTIQTFPIVVNAKPSTDGNAALLRQALAAVGVVAATLSFAKTAGILNLLAAQSEQILIIVGAVGSLVATVAVWVGQLKTRMLSKKAAAMADMLSDDKAIKK